MNYNNYLIKLPNSFKPKNPPTVSSTCTAWRTTVGGSGWHCGSAQSYRSEGSWFESRSWRFTACGLILGMCHPSSFHSQPTPHGRSPTTCVTDYRFLTLYSGNSLKRPPIGLPWPARYRELPAQGSSSHKQEIISDQLNHLCIYQQYH